MKFGICCGPNSVPPENPNEPLSSIPRLIETLEGAGADYIEFSVGSVMADDWPQLRAALEPHNLRVEAFNSFIPAHHRITGPDVKHEAVLDYCREALTRCKALGGEVVVLGSGGARRVPEGFGQGEGEQQFVEFCRALGPIAEAVGIDIAIEPLNSKEDNLVTTVAHGAQLVDEIAHPRIQLLADLYHMIEDNEPVAHAGEAGARLRHTHVADIGRVAPGYAPGGEYMQDEDGEETRHEADFIGFFSGLRRAGYNARCSFEGKTDDFAAQAGPMLDLLRQRWEESAI